MADQSKSGALAKLGLVAVSIALVGLSIAWLESGRAPIRSGSAFFQALAAQRAGDYRTASADFLKVISTTSSHSNATLLTAAYYDLGVIAQNQDMMSRAVDYYKKALAISPTYAPALFNRGVALAPTDPKAALTSYQEILAVTPNDVNTLYNAGLIGYRLGRLTLGRTMLNHAITLDPSLKAKLPSGIRLTP